MRWISSRAVMHHEGFLQPPCYAHDKPKAEKRRISCVGHRQLVLDQLVSGDAIGGGRRLDPNRVCIARSKNLRTVFVRKRRKIDGGM